jgi:hypothetical protein
VLETEPRAFIMLGEHSATEQTLVRHHFHIFL